MQELADGVAFWRSRPRWPSDFHNSDYERWSRENPNGDFNLAWWERFLPLLRLWIATRPVSGDVLTARFMERAPTLSAAWRSACVPVVEHDISTVSWEQVEAFPSEVARIKPTRAPSPVFTSKFCHFLLPKVFPVVDNEGLGNRWTYEEYFKLVQTLWAHTEPGTQTDLVNELTRLIEASGQPVVSEFPMKNKIMELQLMGRQHPGMGSPLTPHDRASGRHDLPHDFDRVSKAGAVGVDERPDAERGVHGIGKPVELFIAAYCMLASSGKLNVSTSFIDDQGVDLVFNRWGRTATLPIQVKSRTTEAGTIRQGEIHRSRQEEYLSSSYKLLRPVHGGR